MGTGVSGLLLARQKLDMPIYFIMQKERYGEQSTITFPLNSLRFSPSFDTKMTHWRLLATYLLKATDIKP